MSTAKPESSIAAGARLASSSGLTLDFNANGSLRRFDHGAISLLLFIGNEAEGGPANLYLRRLGQSNANEATQWTSLLGPASPTRFAFDASAGALTGTGSWGDIDYVIRPVLARDQPAWFWHVELRSTGDVPATVDVTYAQDLALAPYGAVRMNEFYVSQYIDHTPLEHAQVGTVLASRQNQAADGRFPWSIIGSLRHGASFATDALQLYGLAQRDRTAPPGLAAALPDARLQHEHSMVVVRDAALTIAPRATAMTGFFGRFLETHPDASSAADLAHVDAVRGLPEASAPPSSTSAPSDARAPAGSAGKSSGAPTGRVWPQSHSLFVTAPALACTDLTDTDVQRLFGTERLHEERGARGELLAFFAADSRHIVLRAKELACLRPHGHLLRTGLHLTPDESALTSTAWMTGVFHSMLTQGHVSINRFLSTTHSYIGLFRSHGLRVFVEQTAGWTLLDLPSAFEIAPQACRWLYHHAGGTIEVRAEARNSPQDMTLHIAALSGPAVRCLVTLHSALNGDDGSVPGAARWRRDGDTILISAAPDSDVGRRFPDGTFSIAPTDGTRLDAAGGDEMLYADKRSRAEPFVCLLATSAQRVAFSIRAQLIAQSDDGRVRHALEPALRLERQCAAGASQQTLEAVERALQLGTIAPWLAHNAFVHYLSPRGLEQYSGGGWGTRDVCQGPVELLLALQQTAPIRDLLLRVMRMQNPDGDWPQWFMFFDRERNIRPGDSHGDIVFWPVLVLAQYLLASGDRAVLEERIPFFDSQGPESGEMATVWQHTQRALDLIARRVIPGTALAAYGHGDWNDSLQPADPAMREHMCSAWTVTLNHQILQTLARALRAVDRAADAAHLETRAAAIRTDFQRILVVDGVLTGYAVFEPGGAMRCLLHPDDETTGVKYSSLAMIHAIMEDLLTPEQIATHRELIDRNLRGPDGIRLFDQPMTYHGGPQKLFQRAETATFFGREIGLMYMHAHLRFAQALAHLGEAEQFFEALCQANPIGIRTLVPTATIRQANCYYSSSDATFADRAQASAEYDRIRAGTIALEGGWRVYSSGAGIALGLIMRHFVGLTCEADALLADPVIPASLDGLRVHTTLQGKPVEVIYSIGAAGCGVSRLELNGELLALARDPNPHRLGAARVALDAVRRLLQPADNVLEITLGGH